MRKMHQGWVALVGAMTVSAAVAAPPPPPNPSPSYCNGYAATVQGGPITLTPVGNTVLKVTDMSFGGKAQADNCYGAVEVTGGNNDSASALNAVGGAGVGVFGQDDWAFVTKADVGSGATTTGTGSFGGYGFTLTADRGPDNDWPDGNWTLSITGTPLPAYFDIVAVLKGGTYYGAYLFDDVQISATTSGAWSVSFKNNGGNIPDLSHMSIYMRTGTCTGDNCGPDPGPNIPEPATLVLASVALLGLRLARRKVA